MRYRVDHAKINNLKPVNVDASGIDARLDVRFIS